MTTATRYCYHCQTYHPESEMRQVFTKGGTRWRCKKSLNAIKKTTAERDAFGKQVTANNSKQQSVKAKAQTTQAAG